MPYAKGTVEICIFCEYAMQRSIYVYTEEEYLFFLIFFPRGMDCGCSLEPPRQGESNVCRQSVFWAEIGRISQKSTENGRHGLFQGYLYV